MSMKVKIGDVIHDCEQEPIMLILEPIDRLNISQMHPLASRYCTFPMGTSQEAIEAFMGLERVPTVPTTGAKVG